MHVCALHGWLLHLPACAARELAWPSPSMRPLAALSTACAALRHCAGVAIWLLAPCVCVRAPWLASPVAWQLAASRDAAAKVAEGRRSVAAEPVLASVVQPGRVLLPLVPVVSPGGVGSLVGSAPSSACTEGLGGPVHASAESLGGSALPSACAEGPSGPAHACAESLGGSAQSFACTEVHGGPVRACGESPGGSQPSSEIGLAWPSGAVACMAHLGMDAQAVCCVLQGRPLRWSAVPGSSHSLGSGPSAGSGATPASDASNSPVVVPAVGDLPVATASMGSVFSLFSRPNASSAWPGFDASDSCGAVGCV